MIVVADTTPLNYLILLGYPEILPGRREAQGFHLVLANTLAILLQASLRGYCNLPIAVKQPRHYGFWLSDAIEADVLEGYNRAGQQN